MDKTIELPDGRVLAYAEYGDPQGRPIFYFHGNPGSRLDPLTIGVEVLERCNARLIAADRPGMGLSTFQPGRRLIDWPADVSVLADALDVESFAVMGLSGGGPYAAVCAHQIPERLTGAAIVSGIGSISAPGATRGMGPGRFLFYSARIHPGLARIFLAMTKSGLQSTRKGPNPGAPPGMPAADLAALSRPGIAEAFLGAIEESWRDGMRGTALDAALLARPWGFALEEIAIPVHVWHGEADRMVPIGMGKAVAKAIPGCTAHFFPGEGHVSLAANHLQEILEALMAEQGIVDQPD